MRVRDIIHRDKARLRLTLAAGDSADGPLLRLSDPGGGGHCAATICLDLHGAELLAAFVMSARLSAVGELADERCHGDYPVELRLWAVDGEAQIFLAQQDQRLALTRGLWDRLYTELQLVLAHGRHLRDTTPAIRLSPHDGPRLLH